MVVVELFGGRHDGAHLTLPPGPLPELLGVVEAGSGALVPVRTRRDSPTRAVIGTGALYELTPRVGRRRRRYALVRPSSAP